MLQIIAAQPEPYVDQPVVAHVEYIDNDNRYRSYRRAVTLEHAIVTDEFAGRFWGGFECRVPSRTKRFQIEVRPIAADELDLLDAEQLERFRGRQDVTVLLAEGNDKISAVAQWEDQKRAVLAPDAAWFVLAARKEVR